MSFGTYGFNNKSVFSQYVRWHRGTPAFVRANHLCYLYDAQQSVDISCRSDHSSKLCWCDPCWTDRRTDRRTDTVPFHRPCSTYYAGSANNTRHKAAAAGQLTNNMQQNENTKKSTVWCLAVLQNFNNKKYKFYHQKLKWCWLRGCLFGRVSSCQLLATLNARSPDWPFSLNLNDDILREYANFQYDYERITISYTCSASSASLGPSSSLYRRSK